MGNLITRMIRGAALLCFLAACSDGGDDGPASPAEPPPTTIQEGECQISAGQSVDFAVKLGCRADFDALASLPLDQSIPGARSTKVVLDQLDPDGDKLYFQNSTKYQIHYEFASAHLSGNGLPFVGELSEFNQVQYTRPERRFVLGAVTYYEGPDAWVLELSPYDTASADMMSRLYEKVKAAAYFGPGLAFHPTSEPLAVEAAKAPTIKQISTTKLYEGIDYQPLNLGSVVGKLRFFTSEQLQTNYVDFQDIVVLDEIPNDITVVSGMITEDFQTPLSHVNVLAHNRKTPNMALRGAHTDQRLRQYEGQWVRFTVGAFEWSVLPATPEEAAADWAVRRPEGVTLPPLDLDQREMLDVKQIVDESQGLPLRDAIKAAILAYGAKTAHYGVLANTANVPVRKAFGIPIYYYVQFMEENGFYDELDAMLADPSFVNDPAVRDARLEKLRNDMMEGEVDAEFQTALRARLESEFAGLSMRFRTSTNSEDLDGFPCAGCYESHTGRFDEKLGELDWEDVLDALRETWASIWLFRTFEERRYHSIDHKSVGMGLLVHHNFPDEEANGVALTANPFDPLQLQPGFYVNVQYGGANEVVHPPPGITSDEFIYFFTEPGQPTTYRAHSNLVADGETVLTRSQIHELGTALDAIHQRFSKAYGPAAGNHDWYAMDVEFKFDDEDGTPGDPRLVVKQARPYAGNDQ